MPNNTCWFARNSFTSYQTLLRKKSVCTVLQKRQVDHLYAKHHIL